jgi:hypothetical protein
MTIIAICYVIYGDEEGKLCDILLANELRMKNIIMANRCIKM